MSISSAEMVQIYRRNYLPGYTGFVPTKNDFFAMTTGQINKEIIRNGGLQRPRTAALKGASTTQGIGFYPSTPAGRTHIGKNKPPKNVFGNSSKKAFTWISGPNHELCL